MSENLQEALKREFLERECFLNSLQTSEIENEIYIVANRELDFEPFLSKESSSVNLPLQESVVLGPRSHKVINLKFQILFPWKLYGLLKPVLELPQISIFPHTVIIENRIEDGFHLFIKNNTDEKVFLKEGTSIAQLCVKRKIRDMNEKEKIPVSKMEDVKELKILKRPPSFLHAHEGTFYPEFFQDSISNIEIRIPCDPLERYILLEKFHTLDSEMERLIREGSIMNITSVEYDKETVAEDFTQNLLEKNLTTQQSYRKLDLESDHRDKRDVKDEILSEMCQKLAVLAVDQIKNSTITREVFSLAQQSDDYLSVIFEGIKKGDTSYPKYEIRDSVLFRRIYDKHFNADKYVIVY
jgi:hypothetical protein